MKCDQKNTKGKRLSARKKSRKGKKNAGWDALFLCSI
jgi:hypothetical protein